ncbi:MAG: hypothetical protein Q8912_05920 [Bacillota bacterium]|nr:hypothetical protein [Bacillota bacterium]MDP4161345.1 hypothetical protein [Bacillota bacterium]
MKKCEEYYYQRFSLAGQDSGITELNELELKEYNSIYNMLIKKLIDSGAEIPENADLQVINKIFTCHGECVTPMGSVSVSLEYLANLLSSCRNAKIQWLVDVRECTDTHFKELSYCKIVVDCSPETFMTMAQSRGFRYSAIRQIS